jgi:hypothetical protein
LAAVLADSSVWVAHFRKSNGLLRSLLATDQSVVSTYEETLELIERERLQNLGCGAVDMSLLASALLTSDTLLWTLDKNLDALCTRLGVAFTGIMS